MLLLIEWRVQVVWTQANLLTMFPRKYCHICTLIQQVVWNKCVAILMSTTEDISAVKLHALHKGFNHIPFSPLPFIPDNNYKISLVVFFLHSAPRTSNLLPRVRAFDSVDRTDAWGEIYSTKKTNRFMVYMPAGEKGASNFLLFACNHKNCLNTK